MSQKYQMEKHTICEKHLYCGGGLACIVLLFILLTIGLPSTVLADQFKIQRGSTAIEAGNTTATATAPADFEAVSSLSRAFVRVISTQGGGTGDGSASPPTTTIPPDELTATVEFTDTATITFTRSTTSRNCRLYWEIWEYTGLDGGANEFIVRGQGISDTISVSDTYDDEAVSGVTDQNRCVVFLTGVQNSSSSESDYWAHTFHAYMLDASTVRIERDVPGVGVKGSYAVVEFTGSNWDVQTGTHTFSAVGTPETEAISALAGTDKAFLITQHMTAQNGLDEYGYQAWISATDEVSFQLRSTISSPSNHTVRYWVVENTDSAFLVRRGNFTIPDSGTDVQETSNETITAVADLSTTGITFNHDSTGTTNDFPRACRTARLTSTTNLEVYCSRGNEAAECRYETVEFPPNSPPAAPTLFAPVDNFVTSDQTPPLTSSSTDADGDELVYHIQIDNDYDFSSPAVDDTSDSPTQGTFTDSQDPGDTSPFAQGDDILYVPDSALADGTIYYWRVRTRDPAGSDTWSGWSDVRSLTIETSATVPTWRQNTAEQWNNSDNPATFFHTRTNVSDQIELIGPQSGTVYGLTSDGTINEGTTVRTNANWDDVGRTSKDWKRGYLAFDLSGVADISSATITVNVRSENLAAGENIELHQVNWGPVLDTSDWSLFSGATLVQGDFIAGTNGDDTGFHTSIDISSYVTAGAVNYFGLKHNDPDQYDITMYFADTPDTNDQPRLDWSGGSTSGYVMSVPIPFSGFEIAGSDAWSELTFSMSGGDGGTLVLKLYYDLDGTPTIIPNSDLPGNSSGFDTSPVDISGLDTSTYHTLYIRGEFQAGSDPPNLDEWGITGGPVTAVDLIDFRAVAAHGGAVTVIWETAQEINNLGFNLYRAAQPDCSYRKLNRELIPGLLSSVTGKQYTFTDGNVSQGALYYYLLEDVELDGTATLHGPICVDWNADGIPDDSGTNAMGTEFHDEYIEDAPHGIPVATPALLASNSYSATTTDERFSSKLKVSLNRLKARQYGDTVALEWETGHEVDNLGFHVYRQNDGQFYRLTPQLIPGSVFKVGTGTMLPGGQSYAFWDNLAQRTGRELYWLQYVDLNGQHAYYGPIKAQVYGQSIPERQAFRLNEIAKRLSTRYGEYSRIQHLRHWLQALPVPAPAGSIAFRKTKQQKASPPRLPPPEVQWALAAQPAVKILIKEEGWYRLTQPELVAVGLHPDVDPRYLRLFVDGREVPILVPGERDGWFDLEDAVEFYATGLDTPWSDTRIYWLIAGVRPGKRIELSRGRGGRVAPASFPFTVERKDRSIYFAALKNSDTENFFGSMITAADPVDQLLSVADMDPSAPMDAALEVTLQGVTEVSHHVTILLNDIQVGELRFEGKDQGVVEIPIAHQWLLEGDNIVTLIGEGDTMDVSLVDSIRLTYWRAYTAEHDILRCTAAGGRRLTLAGFSTPDIRLVDITDATAVYEVAGTISRQDSGYTITCKVPGSGLRTLYAFTEQSIKGPAAIMDNLTSAWHQPLHGADLVIITHGDFFDVLEPLKQRRAQQGFSVAVVDVEDIYDEFSFGAKTPYALRDFLARAQAVWQPKPRFVLLVGDASFDPRGYLGLGDYDLVPTKLVATRYLETASDDWLVDTDNDGVPEMAIGRLPVRSIDEANAVIAKIIAHEDVVASMQDVLLVADKNDGSFDFEAACYEVAELVPENLELWGIFRGQVGSSTARTELLGMLNEGLLLINYVGHGSTEIWKGSVLTSADAESLTNFPYLPFFVNMTCLNGLFNDVYTTCLAEALLKAPEGGAVAVWASSGLTMPGGQLVINKELMHLLFNEEGFTIGEAAMWAKEATSDEDIKKTWILFGDPTVRIR